MTSDWLVGIPTYKRPMQLRIALDSLVSQSLAPNFDVCVVDNDPARSAYSVVSEFVSRLNIHYMTEPQSGVVHVRNVILNSAQNYAFLAFLDDDQVAEASWLNELKSAADIYPGAAISGERTYQLPQGLIPNRLQRRAFSSPVREPGSYLAYAPTGNCVLPLHCFSEYAKDLRFDPKFTNIGGEDTKYFRDLLDAGVPIRWWPAAKVVEPVPSERASLQATRARVIRSGLVTAQLKLEEKPRLQVLIGSIVRILLGSVMQLAGKETAPGLKGQLLLLGGMGGFQAVCGTGGHYYGGVVENGGK
ncbi:glycosyltransferase family 2 protein [Dietzia sp. B44]|uniref:glycosyltransferase family 2 protein n=1 Tax=Dietzia sp. B44 TaxID=1630633 RepID=UPI0015F98621|nr:glycosyltransferase family 2 protein [Dietzia sp. B44]MBB1055658.1 glycosyltransferase [Dietzia sp. B44]